MNPPPKDSLISQDDMENWGYDNWEPSPYLTKSAEFMSAAIFGREDPVAESAAERFIVIFVSFLAEKLFYFLEVMFGLCGMECRLDV